MTAFDWIAAGLLALSAGVGLARGGVREIAGLGALFLAALAAGTLAGVTAPLIGHSVRPMWLARLAAVAAVFASAYIAVRLAGALLARGVRRAGLGGADRLVGLAFGLVRGVTALGVVAIVVEGLFPPPHAPHWTMRSRLYPLAAGAGDVLRASGAAVLGRGGDRASAAESEMEDRS